MLVAGPSDQLRISIIDEQIALIDGRLAMRGGNNPSDPEVAASIPGQE
jgi:hypothetical protein